MTATSNVNVTVNSTAMATGTHWASTTDFPTLKAQGYTFVVTTVDPANTAAVNAALDAAQANNLRLIIGAWPLPYTKSATGQWTISSAGVQFLNILASRSSLVMAVFVFNEPYWADPWTGANDSCGVLSAADLRALRTAIQGVWPGARIYHDIGTPSWWAPGGGAPACATAKYADQTDVSDYVGIWDYPFLPSGYDRNAALAVVSREANFVAASMAPAQPIALGQTFACNGGACGASYVMPTAGQLADWNCAMRSLPLAGISWYVWHQSLYSDELSQHPELFSSTTAGACGTTASSCDINQDGRTDVLDVQLVVNMALQIKPCTNPDNVCNVTAIQRVVNAVMGGTCVAP